MAKPPESTKTSLRQRLTAHARERWPQLRDVIVRYVVSQGTINPSADGNWSFAPLPGASVVFETGPKAKDFIAEVKALKIEPAGDGEAGFAKYRITLLSGAVGA